MGNTQPFRFVFLVIFALLLAGCALQCSRNRVNIHELTSEEQLAYAKRLFEKRDYHEAKVSFTVVILNNPGSSLIEEAQFYLAESHFHLREYLLAIEEYSKLIRSLPQSEFVDDASYKIGMCYYELSPGYALDQEYTNKAIMQFQQFLEDFPDSEYRADVEQRILECRNKLAKKEFKAGELYRKMNYFRAAIVYFDAVIEIYYDTPFVDDALYWKGECHRRLREWEAAEETFQELLQKRPNSHWADSVEGKLKDVREKKEQGDQEQEDSNL